MMTLIFLAGFLMVGGVGYLAWKQSNNTKNLLEEAANLLSLDYGMSTGNALFNFPSAAGYFNELPVFIGSAPKRVHRGDMFFLQVVVGKNKDVLVRPMPVGDSNSPAVDVPFSEICNKVSKLVDSNEIKAAKASILDGGGQIEVYDDVIVRTFTVNGIQSQKWLKRVCASVKIMTEYSKNS